MALPRSFFSSIVSATPRSARSTRSWSAENRFEVETVRQRWRPKRKALVTTVRGRGGGAREEEHVVAHMADGYGLVLLPDLGARRVHGHVLRRRLGVLGDDIVLRRSQRLR